MNWRKLDRDFYLRSALEVAPALLGKILVRQLGTKIVAGRIVEAEAYLGTGDAASHSHGGRRTKRTEIQYGPGGHAYVYLIYGLHHCLNIVTNQAGIPEGVMLRALEPLAGLEHMQLQRKTTNLRNLCSGPGKLCAALNIDKSCYGLDLCGNSLYIVQDDRIVDPVEIVTAKRINVDYAGAAKDFPWRFLLKGSKFISVKPNSNQ